MSATTTTDTSPEQQPDEPAQPVPEPLPAEPAPRDHRRLRLILLLGALTVASVAWRLWLVRDVAALTVRVDEDGYLIVARALTGGPGGVTTENPLFRHVGYPLLISPVYWFVQDPMSVYKGVQVLNALINSLTLVFAYAIGRRVFGLGTALSVVTAVTVSLIPSVVFYGEFAMTDAVLSPLLLLWVLALHGTVSAVDPRRQARYAIGCGLVAGLLWLIHVRSIVILAVHLAVFGLLTFRGRIPRRVAFASTWGIILSFGVDVLARFALGNEITLSGDNPDGTLMTRLFTPFGIVHTINWAVGQLWYLTISTLGLAAIGGVGAIAWLRRRDPARASRTVTMLALLAITVGIAFFSAATLPDTERINLYAYARYVAFTAPLWMVAAVATLTGSTIRRSARIAIAAALVLLLSAYVVVSYSGRLRTDTFYPFDAPEASALTDSWGRLRIAAVTALALFALVGFATLLTLRRTRYVALGIAIALSLASMPVITANAAAPMSRRYEPGVWLSSVGVTERDTVAQDTRLFWWVKANGQWQVHWDKVHAFDSRKEQPPADATVAITLWNGFTSRRPSWDGAAHGWTLITLDRKSGAAIWRR